MKIFRWVAVAALTLMSLMDVGIGLGGDDAPPVAVRVLIPVLGLLGLFAVYGLIRRLAWGQRASLAAGAINLVIAIVALAVNSDGAAIGLVVSAVAVVFAFLTSYADQRPRTTRPAPIS
jgi:hypothetical protein